MHTLRACFADEIFVEFLPPFLGDCRKRSHKAIIFLDGAPAVPNKKKLLSYWSKKGYWVFHPRYRGTWESRGVFLKDEPTRDVFDVIDALKKPIKSEWDGVVYHTDIRDIFVIGGSFGGPATLFASRDDRVKKIIVVAPVVDWSVLDGDEPISDFPDMVIRAFGQGYRSTPEHWKKLQSGEFYNPVMHQDTFDGNKICIIHAKDDESVPVTGVRMFAQKTKSTLYLLRKGGHLSVKMLGSWRWARRVEKFFRTE